MYGVLVLNKKGRGYTSFSVENTIQLLIVSHMIDLEQLLSGYYLSISHIQLYYCIQLCKDGYKMITLSQNKPVQTSFIYSSIVAFNYVNEVSN